MPTVNHLDLVQSVPPPPSGATLPDLLAFVLRVLAVLPASERAGLLRKDAGENIIWYAPAGVNVSISRVCYPDGQIYKVLTDAGVGGANGPVWNDNGMVNPNLWVPVTNTPPPPPPPPPAPDPLLVRIEALERAVLALTDTGDLLRRSLDQQSRSIVDLRLWQASVIDLFRQSISTSRTWGHVHHIKMELE